MRKLIVAFCLCFAFSLPVQSDILYDTNGSFGILLQSNFPITPGVGIMSNGNVIASLGVLNSFSVTYIADGSWGFLYQRIVSDAVLGVGINTQNRVLISLGFIF